MKLLYLSSRAEFVVEENCAARKPAEALVVPGSDYPGAFRRGTRIALEIEKDTGRVIVTRARGAVKLAYLTGTCGEAVAACLRLGFHYTGRIIGIRPGPGGKLLQLQLEAGRG